MKAGLFFCAKHEAGRGYASDAKKRAAEATGVLWAVKQKAKPGGRLTARQRARNHRVGKVRAKVEHVFRVIKCQFGYRKVRYRGIAKNGARCSRCWHSQTCISPAGHLRPPDEIRPSRSRPPL